jgi:hypothetical protein
MLIIDTLLFGGLRFVLDKIAMAVETELNDEAALREQLLAAQMRVELGEMSQDAYDQLEAEIIPRLRDIKARRRGGSPGAIGSDDMKVTGIEATVEGDEH